MGGSTAESRAGGRGRPGRNTGSGQNERPHEYVSILVGIPWHEVGGPGFEGHVATIARDGRDTAPPVADDDSAAITAVGWRTYRLHPRGDCTCHPHSRTGCEAKQCLRPGAERTTSAWVRHEVTRVTSFSAPMSELVRPSRSSPPVTSLPAVSPRPGVWCHRHRLCSPCVLGHRYARSVAAIGTDIRLTRNDGS